MTSEERKAQAAAMLTYFRATYPEEMTKPVCRRKIQMPDGTEEYRLNISAVCRVLELILDGTVDMNEECNWALEGHA